MCVYVYVGHVSVYARKFAFDAFFEEFASDAK
jgi:hypothetical protein